MQEIIISADELVAALLNLSIREQVCFLDSCGKTNLDSRFLLAGIKPLETHEILSDDYQSTLDFFDKKLSKVGLFAFFTLSYEFGMKINRINPRQKEIENFAEPDLFLALFDSIVFHDYKAKRTYLVGNENRFDEIRNLIFDSNSDEKYRGFSAEMQSKVRSNFTRTGYLEKIEEIKEFIRKGDTYQTNLTQQITAELPETLTPQQIFYNLRKNHPAPFAAFLKRQNSFVVSASPERFFKVNNIGKPHSGDGKNTLCKTISTSPIKGTRPRGKNSKEDERFRQDLLTSEKDRAENVMIVDLLRNDIGRICEYGSVEVEKLCDLEEHPTLFHLVSTINGKLDEKTRISDIIKAVFPCGSITGAPKIRTMQIIEQIETAPRGLSMGAIGYSAKSSAFKVQNEEKFTGTKTGIFNIELDASVGIRTMTIHNNRAIFNVGGGIVIDSDAEKEYEETLTKAKALLNSIGAKFQ